METKELPNDTADSSLGGGGNLSSVKQFLFYPLFLILGNTKQ